MRHSKRHPSYVEGCGPCKWGTVGIGAVPGGASQRARTVSHYRGVEKSLNRYADKRAAGEQPDGISPNAVKRYEKRMRAEEQKEKKIRQGIIEVQDG